MHLARIRHQDRIWLARLEGSEMILVAEESDHPAADVVREALAAGLDLGTAVTRIPASAAMPA